MSVKSSLCCFLTGVSFACAAAQDSPAKTVTVQDVPVPVQKQIKEQLGAAKLEDIQREEYDGEISYAVTATRKDGEEHFFTVGEDGQLLSLEVELGEAPAAVQGTIQAQVGTGTLDSVAKSFEEDEIKYDVDITTKEGKERSFTVALNGIITSLQVDLEEVPAPVRATIAGHAGQGSPGEVYRLFEDGQVSYSIELKRDGKTRDLVVAADGKMEALQVGLSDLPAAARKTIAEKIGSGKILRIDKSFTRIQGVDPFKVQGRKDGKPFNFSVGPKGRFLGRDD
jgi:uncharacterized protein YpmB